MAGKPTIRLKLPHETRGFSAKLHNSCLEAVNIGSISSGDVCLWQEAAGLSFLFLPIFCLHAFLVFFPEWFPWTEGLSLFEQEAQEKT